MKNVRAFRGLALTGVAALGLIAMTPALAESDFVTGNGAIAANAAVDFEINVPRFIRFQVGSTGATQDLVSFDVNANTMGDGNDVAATTNGTLGVSLLGNVGDISLDATTTGPLSNGTDDISWTEIVASSDDAALDVPAIGVHHMEGHLLAPLLEDPGLKPPFIRRSAWLSAHDCQTGLTDLAIVRNLVC